MPTLIKNKQVSELDQFTRVSLKEINQEHEQQLAQGKLALLIESDQSVDDLPEQYIKAPYIAVNFPAFTDGRGYSIARDLRLKKNYSGELRAVGDVLIDQLHAMQRCGFDAFELNENVNIEKALKAFDDFSDKYQSDFIQNKPVYLR